MSLKLSILFLLFSCPIFANHWTYFVNLAGSGNNQPRYYLWVPSQATSIKGLILASEARLSQIAGDSLIRAACEEAKLGIVGFKGTGFTAGFSASDSLQLLQALQQLAVISRFAEVAHCPWIPYGTSVGGIFAWQLANIMPHRVAGIIEDNAIFTTQSPGFSRPFHIPLLVSRGANEQVSDKWFQSRDSVLAFRRQGGPATLLLQAGCGHFGWTQFESRYMAMWLKKLVQARIPEVALTAPITLNPVLEQSGWLSDSSFYAPEINIATFSNYTDDKALAFWHFDQELAQLWKNLHQGQFSRQSQMVVTAAYPENSCPNAMAFQTCDNNVVLGRPGNIFDLNASATSGLPVRYGTYNGAFELQDNTVKITSGALETNGGIGWVVAIQEGNENYQCFERALRFQVRPKTNGNTQNTILSQTPDKLYNDDPFSPTVTLSSGLNPEVFIETGAVKYINGQFTILPFPRGMSTVIVRYGHSGDATLATAISQTDTFLITRNDSVTYTWLRSTDSHVQLQPNPTQSGVFVKLPAGQTLEFIKLLDASGKVLFTKKCSQESETYLNMSQWPAGQYLIETSTSTRKYHSRIVRE
jgi:pimeloyl-ACP methyl ester carboxylesterase